MPRHFRIYSPCVTLAATLVFGWMPVHAQDRPSQTVLNEVPPAISLATLGSAWDERVRLEQLLGGTRPPGYLFRSPSVLMGQQPQGDPPVELFRPELRSVYNSAIPYSLNDGPLWAGRGRGHTLLAGARVRTERLTLLFAPQLVYSQNRSFEILPWPLYLGRPGRKPHGSLWYSEGGNIDLPYRFGDGGNLDFHLGQTTLAFHAGAVDVGFSTENQWWGPGVRNGIIMSDNAPGFSHLFARTARPLRTRVGEFEGKWLLGDLRESAHFDTLTSNDRRSLSAVVVTYSPIWEPRLALGVSRAVYGPAESRFRMLGHGLRFLTRWERRDSAAQVDWEPEVDQLLSLFARWVFPADGLEVYAEWARHELPVSVRDFLLAPHHTRGYTVGLQWARPTGPAVARLQAEVTQLEQSPTFKQRPGEPFYNGLAAEQGYTHRGQVVGAAIGPGSSSQWLAFDLLTDRVRGGVFGSRVRWENDAFYRSPSPDPTRGHRTPHAHDVSLIGGVRGGYALGPFEIGAEYALAKRYNYLFQNPDRGFGPDGAVDVINHTFKLELTPRLPSLVRRSEAQ